MRSIYGTHAAANVFRSTIAVVTALVVFTSTLHPTLQEGFGAMSENNIPKASSKWALVHNVLVANMPQLLLSIGYLVFNNYLTRMLAAHEYTRFASTRKTLRVSRPHGLQRSTYWLQLPYRYVFPLMTTMAVLHWTTSRSLFLVDVSLYNDPMMRPGSPYTNALAYSSMPIIVSISIMLAIVLALVALTFRKLDPSMPIMGSCSIALSAAARSDPREEDPALQPLMYGVLPDAGTDEHGNHRVGFSSWEVARLVDGVVYS